MAVLFPLALLLVLTIVQAGVLWHARNVLSEAAQTGVNVGRVAGGTSADAEAAALSFLNRAGDDAVSAPSVSASRAAEIITVTASGTAHRLLPVPGIEFRLRIGASAPVEYFSVPGSDP